jgi:molybdenum cofactor cytidylyltransferase
MGGVVDDCAPGQCVAPRLRLGGVVLSAGAGSRLGFRPKGLISVGREPLLLRQLRLLSEAGVDDLVVVLGHHSEQLRPLLVDSAATTVVQSGDQHSQASSLRLGASALPHDIDAALIVPVDMPRLETRDLVALIGAYKHAEPGTEFVGPLVNGQPGNPVILSRAIVDQVRLGEGDFGSGRWRHRQLPGVLDWVTDNDRYLIDIDTPEHLEQWSDAPA